MSTGPVDIFPALPQRYVINVNHGKSRHGVRTGTTRCVLIQRKRPPGGLMFRPAGGLKRNVSISRGGAPAAAAPHAARPAQARHGRAGQEGLARGDRRGEVGETPDGSPVHPLETWLVDVVV